MQREPSVKPQYRCNASETIKWSSNHGEIIAFSPQFCAIGSQTLTYGNMQRVSLRPLQSRESAAVGSWAAGEQCTPALFQLCCLCTANLRLFGAPSTGSEGCRLCNRTGHTLQRQAICTDCWINRLLYKVNALKHKVGFQLHTLHCEMPESSRAWMQTR